MESNLKPCPFCGGEAHLAELTGSNLPRPLYYGFCTNGHCQTRMVERRSKQKAIEAWNRRPSEVVHGRWVEADDGDGAVCSVCGEDFCNVYLEVERFNYCPNCGAKMDGDRNG